MDISLAYTKTGKGPALILLQGNGEDGTYFKKQVSFFSRFFTVWTIDTRGHGKSPHGSAPFTLDQFALDLHEFMEIRRIEKANILGFSDGANIAILLARRWPEQVISLVLDGGNLDPKGIRPAAMHSIRAAYALSKLAGRNKAKELLALMVKEPHIDPGKLNDLNMPVLVIAGTNDVIRENHTKLIARSIQNSSLKFIEGDHFIAQKNPQAFNLAVLEFYKRNGLIKNT